MLSFYSEGVLASRQTPKLEDHNLSAICDCLFNILAATHLEVSCSCHNVEDAKCCGYRNPLLMAVCCRFSNFSFLDFFFYSTTKYDSFLIF